MNLDLSGTRKIAFRLDKPQLPVASRTRVHLSPRRSSDQSQLICKAEAASFPVPAQSRRAPAQGRDSDNGKAWQQKPTEQSSQRPALSASAHRRRQGAVGKQKPEQGESVSSSLFVDFKSLPPDGKSVTEEEDGCDPLERRCKTAVHVWELKCKKCYGTGILTMSSRRGGRHSCTCLACHGMGYVRQASSQKVPDFSNGAYSIARDKPEQ